MTLTVLLTGFGPFPGAPFNPTGPLVTELARRRGLGDIRRLAHVFRTSYAAVDGELPALMARHRPDIVLLFGVATRTKQVRIETCAANARSVLASDVDGHRPPRAIRIGGPATLAGSAPHRSLVAALRTSGMPAQISRDAGRYLCNFAYWRALELARLRDGAPLVQFVHVPMVRNPAVPGRSLRGRRLTLADLVRAAEALLVALATAARRRPDPETRVRYSSDSDSSRRESQVRASG